MTIAYNIEETKEKFHTANFFLSAVLVIVFLITCSSFLFIGGAFLKISPISSLQLSKLLKLKKLKDGEFANVQFLKKLDIYVYCASFKFISLVFIEKESISPDLKEKANLAIENLLPAISKETYNGIYSQIIL